MRGRLALWWVLPAIVVLAAGTLTLNAIPVGVLHDDAMYVILARSLATGHGFRYLNLPGEPAATHFPPGYPAFLALLWKVAPDFPGNVFVFKAANVALLAVAAALLAIFFRRRFAASPGSSAVLAVVAGAGVPSLLLSGLVLSEPLFLVLAIAFLIVAEDLASAESRASSTRLALLGALGGAATLVRTTGIALVVAAVIALVVRRRYRDAAIALAAALVLVVPWQLWAGAHGRDVPGALQGAYGPYTGWLTQAIRRDGLSLVSRTLAQTTRQTTDIVIGAVSPFASSAARVVAMLIVVVLIAIGARRAWRQSPVTLLFLAGYLTLVLVWPVAPARYVWGIWPLLLVIPGLAIADVLAWRPTLSAHRAARYGLLACCGAAVLGYGAYTLRGYRQRQWLNIPMGGGMMLRPVVLTVRSRVAEQETAAVTAEGAVYLYTGRRTVPIYSYEVEHFFRAPTVEEEAKAIDAIAAAYPVDVIVASTELQRAAMRRPARGQSAFVLRDSAADALIYARRAR